MKTDELFAKITKRIEHQLEQGVRPWVRPWTVDHQEDGLPRNIRGTAYRGGNVFYLWLEQNAKGYPTPVWLTYKQAVEAGGHVIKGERSTEVFFWKPTERPDPTQPNGIRKSLIAVSYNVFNHAQCEDVPLPASKLPRTEPERHAAAEALIADTRAIIRHGGNRAFYNFTSDFVQLPKPEQFPTQDGYYATAFHELSHWTGHETRLARTYGARFGDPQYAFEELVAELGAAFVTGHLGLANPEREDHAAYIENWLKACRDDPKAFVTAAGKAQHAADFIIKAGEAKEAAPALEEAA